MLSLLFIYLCFHYFDIVLNPIPTTGVLTTYGNDYLYIRPGTIQAITRLVR